MAEERIRTSRLWYWLGGVVLIIAVFFGARALLRQKLPVRQVMVTHEELINNISTNGRVEPETNYEFHSPLSTTVKSIYVQPGEVVSAGKLLMDLDDVQAEARLATALSGVKSAQAALDAVMRSGTQEERQLASADVTRTRLQRDQAKQNYDTLVRLQASGAASASEVAAAKNQLDSTAATLHSLEQNSHSRYSSLDTDRAKAALADAQANLAAARQIVDQTRFHAPIAGTVYSINTGRQDFADQGKLLLQMADLNHERIVAYFDEPDIGKLAVGQSIQIKWDAQPSKLWHGHITRVPATVIIYGKRTVGEVQVAIDGGNGELLPETNVTVTVTTSSEANALTVPREALRSENGKPYVFRILNGELVRTPVTTGTINLTKVAILSGLSEGDYVATGTTDGEPLQESVPIRIVQ